MSAVRMRSPARDVSSTTPAPKSIEKMVRIDPSKKTIMIHHATNGAPDVAPSIVGFV